VKPSADFRARHRFASHCRRLDGLVVGCAVLYTLLELLGETTREVGDYGLPQYTIDPHIHLAIGKRHGGIVGLKLWASI
jgi:hypothetical protein